MNFEKQKSKIQKRITNSENRIASLKEAQALIIREAKAFNAELVDLENCYGRILASAIYADRNYPPFNRSAVDGFAIKSNDFKTYKEFEIIEEIHAGSVSSKPLINGQAIKIMTGAPVPESADTVIKVEDSIINKTKVSFSINEIKSGANIAKEGEDKRKHELAIDANTICSPSVVGVLASLGIHQVRVHKNPIISIISTGNEIKSPKDSLLPHQIRDSNSYTLAAFFDQYHIKISNHNLVGDNKTEIRNAITGILHSDILILSGGVSMGDADFVPEILSELGVEKIFHKVAIKPGKPIWFGKTSEGKIVFALPGNPFSCQVSFKIFIEPYLRACFQLPAVKKLILPMGATKKKKTSFDDFFPFKMNESSTHINPVKFNGSGDFCSVIHSDGIAIHPSEKEDLLTDDQVEVYFWNKI
jgi:molybdopterin molybdotransferase